MPLADDETAPAYESLMLERRRNVLPEEPKPKEREAEEWQRKLEGVAAVAANRIAPNQPAPAVPRSPSFALAAV